MANKSADSASDNGRKLQLMRDTAVEFTGLYLAVYVEGPPEEAGPFPQMFVRASCRKADTPEEADLVVFAGGEDVNPALYHEARHSKTSFNVKRDESDMLLYKKCLDEGIPMMGVCRGAQFLWVMNGGKLYQDIDNHVGDHSVYDPKAHTIIDKVSSVHHQCCIRSTVSDAEILAESSVGFNRWRNNLDKVRGVIQDVEAYFIRETCCLGIQGHPEYRGYDRFLKWTFDQIEHYVVNNPDIYLAPEKVYRVRPALLEQRAAKWAEKVKELN